jgi:DNA-binding beta-propeller fold protein YncE
MPKGRRFRRGSISLVVGLATVTASDAGKPRTLDPTQQMPTVYVLDQGRKTVHAASFDTGLLASSPVLPEQPGYAALAPDGHTLLVFTKPPLSLMTGATDQRGDGRFFIRPKATNAVSIIDTRTMTVRATLDGIGWNATPIEAAYGQTLNGGSKQAQAPPTLWGAWDSSGQRFTVVCLGKNDQPAEAVQIEVSSASITGRLRLADGINDVGAYTPLTVGESAAVLLSNSLVLINLHDVSASRVIPVRGSSTRWALSPKEDVLYLHSSGSGLQVISLKTLAVTKTLPVPVVTGIANDDERNQTVFVGRTKSAPVLMVFRGEEQVELPGSDANRNMLPLADFPLALRVAPKTRRLYVLCYDSVQVIDSETFSVVGSIASPHRTTGLNEQNGRSPAPPSLLALDSTEQRGFLSYFQDDEISVLDLKALKAVGEIDVVSGLGNFARTMALAAAAGAAQGAGAASLGIPLRDMPPVAIPELPPARYSRMLVGPNDRFLYVLDANRLRVIDTATGAKLSDLSVRLPRISSFEFRRGVPDSFLLVHGYTFSDSLLSLTAARSVPKVAVFDTRTNERLKGTDIGSEAVFTPDGRFAIHFDDHTVYCSDAENWNTLKTIAGFKRITQVAVSGSDETH